jgi:hypothetical protein
VLIYLYLYTYEENLLLPRVLLAICRGWELASTPTHMCSLPACLPFHDGGALHSKHTTALLIVGGRGFRCRGLAKMLC